MEAVSGIDYPLAKELKNAGFPQNWNDGNPFFRGDGVEIRAVRKNDEPLLDFTSGCSIPTLEELIEACGAQFDGVARRRHPTFVGEWSAYTVDMSSAGGRTPTEAVAHLWLALNKKQPEQAATSGGGD